MVEETVGEESTTRSYMCFVECRVGDFTMTHSWIIFLRERNKREQGNAEEEKVRVKGKSEISGGEDGVLSCRA